MEPVFTEQGARFKEKYRLYDDLLRNELTEKRYYHSLCVAAEAMRLAEKFSADTEKAFLAGLLHDIMKDAPQNEQLKLFEQFGILLTDIEKNAPKLWHAMAGALYIEWILQIRDRELINAVRYHTTARADMSLLEKIIYLADFTSADRTYDGVDTMRAAVNGTLETAMYEALHFSVEDLQASGRAVHPDTLAAYEQYAQQRN